MYICAIRVIRSLLPKSQTAFLGALCETFVPFVVSFWLWLRYAVLICVEYSKNQRHLSRLAVDQRSSAAKKLRLLYGELLEGSVHRTMHGHEYTSDRPQSRHS